MFLDRGEVLVFGQHLAALERGQARIDHHIGFEVQDALDVAQRHVQHQADAGRQRFQKPDMRGGAGQFDVAHALATHLGQRDFGAALLAHHATVLHALVLAAQAFVVLDGPEDGRAEQTVTLRLEGAVVDGFGFLHFAPRPRADQVGRGQRDLDRVEVERLGLLVEEVQKVFHCLSPRGANTWSGGSQAGTESGSRERGAGKEQQAHGFSLLPAPSALLPHRSSSSMSIASERISLTSTLNDSGMPADIWWLPSTIFLYMSLRPCTSSDLTVSISCRVYAAP